jgi:hydrogenase-4 transcriptional activator
MKKASGPGPQNGHPPAAAARASRRAVSAESLDAVFAAAGQSLRDGLSTEAERVLADAIRRYRHTPDDLANLRRLLSFALETVGRYAEAFEVLKPYEDEEALAELRVETQVLVTTQLAVSFNNLDDQPRAATLLRSSFEKAREHDLKQHYGTVNIALSRVYRKLHEHPIARDYAEKALNDFRASGNWLGMAEAYREIALSFHREGDSEKALEFFDLGIQIIGDRSAPFMLGKLYTDMSGAYVFLRRPQEGIACLEKSIVFFDRTEHVLNSVIAYNNLGLNLLLIGEWTRAEAMFQRALDLAVQCDHAHVAGILDSLGELKILRGEFEPARLLLERAVDLARQRGHGWYTVQAMRNLARCFLAEHDFRRAEEIAREAIEISAEIDDKHYANMAALVLAESLLFQGDQDECESCLRTIEESDATADFFVLGNIQRIRGLAALENGDRQLALHFFHRCLTIFEAAEDLYHVAVAHLLIGENLAAAQGARAARHLASAEEIFRKLGTGALADAAAAANADLGDRASADVERPNSVVSQLLTVRLAEATASRELLFRELVAVLQQESRATRMILVEEGPSRRLLPFITHGFSGEESRDLTSLLSGAVKNGTLAEFSRKKDTAVFTLRALSAPLAYLLIQPAAGAVLNDGTSLQPLLRVVELAMDVAALRRRDLSMPLVRASSSEAAGIMPGFIHSSPAMTALVDEIYKIRSSDVTVLVTGESGTGKELVARAIHTLSNRKDRAFIPFNCTAVPKELAEGHLFGYRKGAFTGAVNDSPGMIRSADGGTLFLDEIGDLPLDVQPKILRFLQEGEIQPIGEKRPIKVDVRVIAATNMPLEEKVAEGAFREDLYYRLNVIRLRVPPLRERRAEIPPIVDYYINHYSARFGKRDVVFTPQTVDLLMVCNWEGNVRELCNEVQRIVARAEDGEVITPAHLSPELRRAARPLAPFDDGETVAKPIASYDSFIPLGADASSGTLENAVGELEMRMIKGSLARHKWNISRAASELGLTRRGLYLKLSRYGIEKTA